MPHGKCKLCLQVSDLQNSHLMPSSLFKKSRMPGASNPNPLIVTERGSVQTSRQLRNFVLCRSCEQLFSKKGEAYVMTQVFDGTKFPLLDMLLASTAARVGPDFVGYELVATPKPGNCKSGDWSSLRERRSSTVSWRPMGWRPVDMRAGSSDCWQN
jgi:hypothetical protein